MRYRPIKLSRLEWAVREGLYWDSRITLGLREEGEEGRSFFHVQRGLGTETVAKFRLGYVPFGVNADPAFYFAGRVIFPIFDAYDGLLALSARPVRDDWEVDQSYWNESYPKGEHLYGLNLAKYAIVRYGFVIIVEGQMDVLRMHSCGLTNTVGILGGAFTPIHANLLMRYTQNFIFVMDGDKGGREHAEAAKELLNIYKEITSGRYLARKNRIQHAFATLPEGSDPDSYLGRYGGKAMRKEIETTMATNGMKVLNKWLQR